MRRCAPLSPANCSTSRLGTLDAPYNSGVWRYKELIYPDVDDALIVSRPEGNTNLYHSPRLAEWAGVKTLYLKHEGENPTGSFKDRGMTGGLTQARVLGMKRVACASTGNTSASLAAYAAWAGIDGIVLFQDQQIALGKLAQAVAYGATCIRIAADFDRNLELVRQLSSTRHLRAELGQSLPAWKGRKSIMIETIQQLRWKVPDWFVCPGGNLGNTSAFGKALRELYDLGLIDRMPAHRRDSGGRREPALPQLQERLRAVRADPRRNDRDRHQDRQSGQLPESGAHAASGRMAWSSRSAIRRSWTRKR